MLTKKQVESLPKGHYTASQLRAMFPPKKKETKSEKKEITPGKGLLEVICRCPAGVAFANSLSSALVLPPYTAWSCTSSPYNIFAGC